MAAFPDDFRDLLDDATRAYLVLGTSTAAGAPLLSPVWFVAEADGARLLTTTAPDSLKARHVATRPGVAGVVVAQGDLVRYVHVRGRARIVDDARERDRVYARIVRRYEGPDAVGTAGEEQVLVAIDVERATGFDYHGFQA